jgi:hypothetical protein
MVEFSMVCKNITPVETRTFPFTIAAHPAGTDTVDSQLGEFEIPNLGFPGDVFYVWTVPPLPEVIWLSPKDVRQLRAGQQYREEYRVEVNWTGGTLEIAVPAPLPQNYIDSVVIVDDYTDYPNNIVRYRVGTDEPIKITNVAIRKFRVLVWYNALTLDVDDDTEATLSAYPNPVTDHLTLIGMEGTSELRVTSMTGELMSIMTTESDKIQINCSSLSNGTYLVTTSSVDGRIRRIKFVKY